MRPIRSLAISATYFGLALSATASVVSIQPPSLIASQQSRAIAGFGDSDFAFREDFSGTSIESKPNGYVGGWFSPQVDFGEWVGFTSEVRVESGALVTAPTAGTRSGAVVLDPSYFGAAGSYSLSFDLDFTGDTNNLALVSVWSGSGYDLSGTSGNGLIVDTYEAALRQQGNAAASELATLGLNASQVGIELEFDYDGTSAIAMFFGAQTGGFPFPTAIYDNISIAPSPDAGPVVPEPSTALLTALLGLLGLARRRR